MYRYFCTTSKQPSNYRLHYLSSSASYRYQYRGERCGGSTCKYTAWPAKDDCLASNSTCPVINVAVRHDKPVAIRSQCSQLWGSRRRLFLHSLVACFEIECLSQDCTDHYHARHSVMVIHGIPRVAMAGKHSLRRPPCSGGASITRTGPVVKPFEVPCRVSFSQTRRQKWIRPREAYVVSNASFKSMPGW